MQRTIALLLFLLAAPLLGQPISASSGNLTPAEGQALVTRALANELNAAQDASHPMRYRLHKTSPRYTTTKEIVETRDGDVARLIEVFDKPLDPAGEQGEQARLTELEGDPAKQRKRKQAEEQDADRAMKVLRALPTALVYQYAGSSEGSATNLEKFTFRPNPSFSPPDLETQVLTQISGEIWIDAAHQRVTRLEAHLQQDVDFGWGILGRLNKGGWIVIEQADVGEGQWRTVRFQMVMSGRVVFKNRVFDTTEDQTHFVPVPKEMGFQDAIKALREDPR